MAEKKSIIPYGVHSADELEFLQREFAKVNRTIYDVNRFWSQTREYALSVVERIKQAGFLFAKEEKNTRRYEDVWYDIGSFSLIYPEGTKEEHLLVSSDRSSHEFIGHESIGKLVYWSEGFSEEPITVVYDMGINVGFERRFENSAKLESFLRENNLPFQVTPTLKDVKFMKERALEAVEMADAYGKKRYEAFKQPVAP